ncbi:MAG TPA: glycerol-3-phosphate 1-O-acyltransferase PlsY [Trueperaceae bacterium]|nr:glycerol-3-phosphate 1-O-acyltransferase PlsY [Trueperaceae bacterium]
MLATVSRRSEDFLLDVALSVLCIIVGYFLGTIPTGFLVAKLRGVDIQKVGSGNIGATNVLRALGTLPAIIVVILDPLKGALAALIPTLTGTDTWTIVLSGLAAVLGNNFNVLLRLRGGKGIATSIGVYLVIDPFTALLCIVLGVATILISRMVSLGSLVGMFSLPLFVLAGGNFVMPHLFLAFALTSLAVFRHRENIGRLLAGTERRLGEKRAAPPPSATPPVSN